MSCAISPLAYASYKENFEKMKESASAVGVNFPWEFNGTGTIHARHIVTDHGWKISLDRGGWTSSSTTR